jgi:hypothetical protein
VIDLQTLKGLVAFAVLMENGGGILEKSPDYVCEKIACCTGVEDPGVLLDPVNLSKYREWFWRWLRQVPGTGGKGAL